MCVVVCVVFPSRTVHMSLLGYMSFYMLCMTRPCTTHYKFTIRLYMYVCTLVFNYRILYWELEVYPCMS